jgi:D-xylose transport system substrate-binding protein
MADVRRMCRVLRIGLAAAIAGPSLTACRQPADRTVIAVLTPASALAATLATDPGRSAFIDRITARCDTCVVADHYEGATAASARVAVADGADVIVVEALTSDVGEEVVVAAGTVPVVAFDRFVAGADWYVGYDRAQTGAAVAAAVAREVDADADVLVVAGSAVDADTDVVGRGLSDGLAGRGVDVRAELAATSGTATETRDWVLDQLEDADRRQLGAVLAATDEQAQGVVDAFRQARLPRPWPLVTGAGGELDAVRRVVVGDQTFTVHMPVTKTAERAADVALSLASAAGGSDLTGAADVDGVPAFLYDPLLVGATNVTDRVVRDGTFTPEEICSGEPDLERACARLGIR